MPAITVALTLTLTGCAQAERDTSTTPATHHPVGDTTRSITEVREALLRDDVRGTVNDQLGLLLARSEDFRTPFEFERDLLVCEHLHPIPADHPEDHPVSKPLAQCVADSFQAHQEGRA